MNKKKIIVIVIVLLVLAAAIFCASQREWIRGVIAPTPSPTPEPTPRPTSTFQVKPHTTPGWNPNASEGVSIPGWSTIELPANVTEADVELYNPEANADKYYLTFTLSIEDTGEVLFSTGLVPPVMVCDHVILSRKLSPGYYQGVLHVQPYRMADQSPTNSADVSLMIHVK